MKSTKILNTENLEETYQVRIYTDSSLKIIDGISYVSYGYIIESNIYNIKYEKYNISEGTISFGEMNAIYIALVKIEELIKLNIIPKKCNIILFSDSEYCIKSLNEWIFSWYSKKNGNEYIKSDGKKVVYQYLIDNIIKIIVNSNMNIKMYHTYGHVDNNDYEKLKKLKMKLFKSGLKVNTQLVKQISNYNSVVDCNSRLNFNNMKITKSLFLSNINIYDKEIKKYKKLINKKNI